MTLRFHDFQSLLASQIHSIQTPLPPNEEGGWKGYPLFKGFTANKCVFSCHVSVLTHGQSPHPPHRHPEEELLLLLNGQADLLLSDAPSPTTITRHRLSPGQIVYYPGFFPHTIETVSLEPANYLMIKWKRHGAKLAQTLPFGIFDSAWLEPEEYRSANFKSKVLFNGRTGFLRKLQGHATRIHPGGGYAPHNDPYDVMLIILEGEVESLGQRLKPNDLAFYAAHTPHGIQNTSPKTARYVVFEFHHPPPPSLIQNLFSLVQWKALLTRLLGKTSS